jgi:hypothetical protein
MDAPSGAGHIWRVMLAATILCLLLPPALAACGDVSSRDPRPPSAPPPAATAQPVKATAGVDRESGEVVVVARTGLSDSVEAALLLTPPDAATPGEAVLSRDFRRSEVDAGGDRSRPVVGVAGTSGGDLSVGVGFDLTPLFRDLPEAERGRYRLWETRLAPPDPDDYRENWRGYAIEVQYRDVLDDPRVLRIAAPNPG